MKIKPIVILKIVVTVGLLTLVFTRIDLVKAWTQFQELSWLFVILTTLYYLGLQWLSCLRWQIVLKTTKHFIPVNSLLNSYLAGMFLNLFLPGAVGGDVYRVYQVSKHTRDSEVAIASVFLERFTGLAALSALGVMGFLPAFKVVGLWDIILLFLACAAALVGGVLLIVSPQLLIWTEPFLNKLRLNRLAARLKKIQGLLRQFAQHRQALALSMSLSFLIQLGIIYYHYLVAQQLKIEISYLELLVFIPIIVVITLLPISVGGLGLKEGLWIYLFSRIGLTAEQALLLSLTMTLLSWLSCLPGGIILLLNSTGLQQMRREKII